ncbi:MAG TPA: ribonuclease E/G, partial [Bdellovibrionota bacterium]|nr:ribonuclease E/G [Bdellovibrionota bacterium]
MSSELIINSTFSETRIAILSNGEIRELHVERERDKGIVGNIYKGKVVRVLPGMQAAFVDISIERAAFLYVGDIHADAADFAEFMEHEEDPEIDIANEEEEFTRRHLRAKTRSKDVTLIENLIKEGQEILVQIAKEAIGTKGARITTHITIPGRYVVFMPTVDHIGISRKIVSEEERFRLRKIVEGSLPKNGGFIVRTLAENKSHEVIQQDMEYLLRLWEQIQKTSEDSKAPALIHTDLDILLRAVRDMFTEDVERLVIDSEDGFKKVRLFVESYNPRLKDSIV